MDACWYNPKGKPLTGDTAPDHIIKRISEPESMLL